MERDGCYVDKKQELEVDLKDERNRSYVQNKTIWSVVVEPRRQEES